MYIPAALRPTDRPTRSSPLTPPRSVHGSTDSLENPADPKSRPVSRRSTGPKKNMTVHEEEEEDNDELDELDDDDDGEDDYSDRGAVTGPPTTFHWKPDAHASVCDGLTCQKFFGLFERRHHCRHCGNIFCKEHSSLRIPLNQNAEFHPKGAMVRSCEHCRAKYDEWVLDRRTERQKRRRGEGSGGELGGGGRSGSLAFNSPVRLIGSAKDKTPEVQKGGVASSVTRDWNWSTF